MLLSTFCGLYDPTTAHFIPLFSLLQSGPTAEELTALEQVKADAASVSPETRSEDVHESFMGHESSFSIKVPLVVKKLIADVNEV